MVCQKPNLRIAGLIFLWYGEAIQRKGGDPTERDPIIAHIDAMLARMRPEGVRAVYMVVKELDDLLALKNRLS